MHESLKGVFDLHNRTAVVTGGGQGLGKSIAFGLAEFGANIVVVDVNEESGQGCVEELDKAGHNALFAHCDVTNERQVQKATDDTVDKFGSIEILVNSAGTLFRNSIDDFPMSRWQRVIEVNLSGTFLFARTVGKVMLNNTGGSIVNIASVAGFVGRGEGNSAYLASKAGIINLTRHLAIQWATKGVRVNALAPAQFDTPLLDDIRQVPGALDARARRIPMGRIGQPHEIVGPAVFLASDAASFVTGQILAVDGGLLAY